ncbi:hypothetical protein [Nocardioides sp.]|uniref:hypothetical protein n=1 Tax=Nocardioides sp. TaxID=35761 RepID=UPI002EDB04C4
MYVATHLIEKARRWPVDSQLVARRNAMVASTALAQRRAEREEVEEYLASRHQAPAPELPAAHAAHG